MNTRIPRRRRGASLALLAIAGLAGAALTGCAPGSAAPTAQNDVEVSTELTSDPVELTIADETGFPVTDKLTEEFTKQHPNVTFTINRDTFQNLTANAPKLLASSTPPDLIRLPTLGDTVRDGLVANLDPYFDAYGWDAWPASQLAPLRMNDEGVRGSGSLYQLGLGYSITGIYMNTTLADQLGIDPAADARRARGRHGEGQGRRHPADHGRRQRRRGQLRGPGRDEPVRRQGPVPVVDVQRAGCALRRVRKRAGCRARAHMGGCRVLPVRHQRDRLLHLHQPLLGGRGPVHLQRQLGGRANYQKALGSNVEFFLVPPAEAGADHVAMGAANSFSVAAKSPHINEVAYFLNWVHTDPTARQIIVDVTGASPGGDPAQELPTVEAGSLIENALKMSAQIGAENGQVDFMANTTAGIYAGSIIPESQLLVTSQITGQEFVDRVQKFYESEVGE